MATENILKYSKDGLCEFNSEFHTYKLNGKRLTGVTSYISKFKNVFDSDLIAERYAKKHKLNKDEVLAKWKLEGELSCEYGSAVHDIFETYIKTGQIITTGKYEKEAIAVRFIEQYFKTGRLIPIEAEIVVYDESLGLASMIDCIAKNKWGEYFIFDWKTNKKIDWDSWGKYMLEPYNCYPDSNFYHYSLQLSLYKKMYKEFPIKEAYIVHLDLTDYNIIQSKKIKI